MENEAFSVENEIKLLRAFITTQLDATKEIHDLAMAVARILAHLESEQRVTVRIEKLVDEHEKSLRYLRRIDTVQLIFIALLVLRVLYETLIKK